MRTSDRFPHHNHLIQENIVHMNLNAIRAYFHHFGTMTHTPGIGNFSA